MGLTAGRSGAHGPTGPGVQKVVVEQEARKFFLDHGCKLVTERGASSRHPMLQRKTVGVPAEPAPGGSSACRPRSPRVSAPTLRQGGGQRG